MTCAGRTIERVIGACTRWVVRTSVGGAGEGGRVCPVLRSQALRLTARAIEPAQTRNRPSDALMVVSRTHCCFGTLMDRACLTRCLLELRPSGASDHARRLWRAPHTRRARPTELPTSPQRA